MDLLPDLPSAARDYGCEPIEGKYPSSIFLCGGQLLMLMTTS